MTADASLYSIETAVAPVCDGKQMMHLISALIASCDESELNGAELRPHSCVWAFQLLVSLQNITFVMS